MNEANIFDFVRRHKIPYFVAVGNSLGDYKDYFLCVCTADILLIPKHPFNSCKTSNLSQYDLTDSECHWFSAHKDEFTPAHICSFGMVYEPTDGMPFKWHYKKIGDI